MNINSDERELMPMPSQAVTRPEGLEPINWTCRKGGALLGFICGLAAVIVFTGVVSDDFKNIPAVVLGATNGVWSFVVFLEHRRRQAAENKNETVKGNAHPWLITFGALGAITGLISFGYFLATSLAAKQAVSGTSGYIGAVWGFLTLKWGILMMWYSHGYQARHLIWVRHFANLGIYEDEEPLM
eukprot:gene5175-33108_t